jgi:hypothetical protein
MKNYLKQLNSANGKLSAVIQKIERELSDKIEFEDYSIFYQPSDGFVLEYESHNAPLSLCLDVIKEKGILSFEDYRYLCI